MIINDPLTGDAVQVTADYRLKVACITSTLEHQINHHDEECYSIGVSVTPNAGASTPTCILYIKNNSTTDLILSENMLSVDTTNVFVSINLGDSGTPTNTAAVPPVNRTAGSGNTADATVYIGADGGGIGGVTGGNAVTTIKVIAGNESRYFTSLSGIIVPKNQILTIWASGDCTGL